MKNLRGAWGMTCGILAVGGALLAAIIGLVVGRARRRPRGAPPVDAASQDEPAWATAGDWTPAEPGEPQDLEITIDAADPAE